MQSLVYLTEEADAQLQNGNYSMALKRYDAISKVRPSFARIIARVVLTAGKVDI